jgi:hypothetical protein
MHPMVPWDIEIMSVRSVVLAFPWRGLTALGCLAAIFVHGGPIFVDKRTDSSIYIPAILLVAFGIGLGISAVRSRLHWERHLGLPAVVAGSLLAAYMAYDYLYTILRH